MRSGGPLPSARRKSTRPDANTRLIPLLAALRSRGVCGVPEPALDAVVIVFGLAAIALAVWLVVIMLTLGT
jgi:hypothetical protein